MDEPQASNPAARPQRHWEKKNAPVITLAARNSNRMDIKTNSYMTS
jgi:hypothetical protein